MFASPALTPTLITHESALPLSTCPHIMFPPPAGGLLELRGAPQSHRATHGQRRRFALALLRLIGHAPSGPLLHQLDHAFVAAVGPVRLGRGGALLRAEAQRRPYPSCSSLSPRRSTEGAYLKAFKILTTLQMLMAPSWRVVLCGQPRLVAGTSVFEGKHEVLHSLTSLGWRLAFHIVSYMGQRNDQRGAD